MWLFDKENSVMIEGYKVLYLCDGYACKESEKQCCYTQGFECHHTTNVKHAITRQDPYTTADYATFFITDCKSKLQIQHFVKGEEFENKLFEERRELIFTLRKLLKTE